MQFERDIAVWNHKKFLKNPLLVKEDKLISKFRRWFSQFYSEHSPTLRDLKQRTLDWWSGTFRHLNTLYDTRTSEAFISLFYFFFIIASETLKKNSFQQLNLFVWHRLYPTVMAITKYTIAHPGFRFGWSLNHSAKHWLNSR